MFGCPTAIHWALELCVPQVWRQESVLRLLTSGAPPPANFAALLRHLPLPTEVDRLRLVGAYLRARKTHDLAALADAVRWECFPAAWLDAALRGDFGPIAEQMQVPDFPAPFHPPPAFQQRLTQALLQRLYLLEGVSPDREDTAFAQGYLFQDPKKFGASTLRRTTYQKDEMGLMGHLGNLRPGQLVDAAVRLSSHHRINAALQPDDHPVHPLFTVEGSNFGTRDQRPDDAAGPWIEVVVPADVEIAPAEFVIAHGWCNSDVCRDFRIEGCRQGEEATVRDVLLECHEEELQHTPTYFAVAPPADQAFYHAFRLIMTGPTTTGTWFLMISWFDVFGTIRARFPGV